MKNYYNKWNYPMHKKTDSNDKKSFTKNAFSAVIASIPLAVAVIPWGILCGTLSIQAGLSSFQAQLMSLIVFAGAVQLASITILGGAGSWATLFNSTTMISVRHLLYSAKYKADIAPLSFWKRFIFAFLLTDEMFAIAQVEENKTGKFDYWYAVIAGFSFYVIWQIATFMGIYFANSFDNIDKLGFDFAIVATFIAMLVPMIKHEMSLPHPSNENSFVSHPVFVAVMVTAVMALVFEFFQVQQGLIFSTLLGMVVGAWLNRNHNPDESLHELESIANLTETDEKL